MLFIASKWLADSTVFGARQYQDRQPFYLIGCHYGAVFMPQKARRAAKSLCTVSQRQRPREIGERGSSMVPGCSGCKVVVLDFWPLCTN